MKRRDRDALVALSVARVIRNIAIAVSVVVLFAGFLLVKMISN